MHIGVEGGIQSVTSVVAIALAVACCGVGEECLVFAAAVISVVVVGNTSSEVILAFELLCASFFVPYMLVTFLIQEQKIL